MSTPGYQASTSSVQRDPTAIMGARSVAWLVDAVLFGLILLFFLPTPVSPLATYYEIPDGVDDACQSLQDDDSIDVGLCLPIGDRAYVTEPAVAVLQFAVELGLFMIVLVVWQGYTGMTPGKALLGLRTVGEDGQPPGMGKAFVRSILWVVDGLPGIPLVGFIAAATSTGHRRVGDMAAKTYVVSASDAGQPITVPGYAPGYTTPSPAAYSGYGATGYQTQAQPGATAWSQQQQQQPQTGYPVQPPTAAEPTYGAAPSPYGGTPAAQPSQPTSPYGMPAAQPTQPASPYGTPAAQPTEQASPYGGTPAAQPTDPASPYGTPAAQPTEQASPYGGTPAAQPTDPTQPTSPYGGMPAAQPSEPATGAGASWPAQATPVAEPEPAAPQPEPSAEATSASADRPITWPPVVPSPESIGVSDPQPGASPSSEPEASLPAPGETPPAVEAEPDTGSTFAGLAGYMGSGTPAAEPEAQAPAPEPVSGEPTGEVPAATAEGGSGYKPQWDAARGAYIQWDPNRQRWLQFDDATQEWKVI